MIGLDTNILVRYLTQDDATQSTKAAEIIERRLTEQSPGFLSVDQIAAAIERILQIDVFSVENEQEVFTAMIAFKERRGSFADALIAGLSAKAGCSFTLTFDHKALRLPGFKLP